MSAGCYSSYLIIVLSYCCSGTPPSERSSPWVALAGDLRVKPVGGRGAQRVTAANSKAWDRVGVSSAIL